MEISLEAYALVNLIMNGVIIGVIARSRGRVRWGGVALGAAFGTLYAVAMACGWYPQLAWPPVKLAMAVVLALVSLSVESWRDLATGTLLLLGGTVFVGGAAQLAISLAGRSGWSLYGGSALGVAALAAALEARGRKLERWEAQVRVALDGRQASLKALVDTGNRLHEPISGLPVLIVEERAVRRMLPPSLDAARPDRHLPPRFRLVAYGALGGSGKMACFRPDELLVCYGEGWLRAPDVWVAVYPGKMPGGAQALAPAVIGRIAPAEEKQKFRGEGSGVRWSIPRSKW